MTASLLLSALLAVSPPPRTDPTAERKITAGAIRAHTRFLASDLLEGRGPATRGDKLAEEYIAAQFEALGLEPAGADGTYFQPFDIVGVEGHPDTVTFSRAGRPLVLKNQSEVIAVAGNDAPHTQLDGAELVFVGYGIQAPEFQWDDYKGVDLKGKVLLMMNNDPEDDPGLFAGTTRLYYGRWTYKYEIAAKLGALGAIIIHTQHSAGYVWSVVQTSWAGEQFSLPEKGPRLAVRGWATEDASRRIAALAGQDLDALRREAERRTFRPVLLGVTVSAAFDNRVHRVRTENVLGRLPGSDPQLADQAVLYTAHHDHLGMRTAGNTGKDVIYNGAEDNASGVATMLTVARAFAALPKAPRRSVIFAAVAGEEQGLIGSQYLAEHPPVPAGRIAADINADGANIFGRTRDVSVIGLGKTELDPTLAVLAKRQGRRLTPDQFPDRGFFYRSDQFSLARVGIPAAYFGSGVDYRGRPPGWGKQQKEKWEAIHYHQPSDELTPDWDLSGAAEDAKLQFELGYSVAQADAMPEWKPGDEFEAARKAALSAARAPGAAAGTK